jgi:sterol desaturase/sphingolipid hydroxylase (fatty acid hydroxylase superfamily)
MATDISESAAQPGTGQVANGNDSKDAERVEALADEIQKEWRFKISRFPENAVARYGIVMTVLTFLEILLIVSNHIHYLGFWERFTQISTSYRDAFRGTDIARATHLDSVELAPYHMWRGWVVPSFLAGSLYIIAGILALRYELYHWQPELLAHYFEETKKSALGRVIPHRVFDVCFQVYEDKHRVYLSGRLQPGRKHKALQDSRQFLRIMRTVAFNIFLSVVGVFLLWVALLQTKIEAGNIVKLPKSYVPPVQGIVWYLINDCFYFYPHWIAHKPPTSGASYARLLPGFAAEALHDWFNQWHRPHHQTKANLGIAAWYCSPWEHIFFNLFPAFLGPLLTQVLADAAGVEKIWGTHLVTLYVWLMAAAASSVLAHTGYRSRWNDPGKHDLHHEHAMNPKTAVNFGTFGFFDWLHGTLSSLPAAEAKVWRTQWDRQIALFEASKRLGVALTKQQRNVVKQPDHNGTVKQEE